MLSLEDAQRLFAYDPGTGVLRWKVRVAIGTPAGSVAGQITKAGYVRINYGYKKHAAHRIAWLLVYGQEPKGMIDHIDGNKANNAIANLRESNASLNQQNVRLPRCNNKTGYLGVCLDKGRFIAQIHVGGGRRLRMGPFETPEEASAAYLEAKAKHHAHAAFLSEVQP